MRLPSSHGHSKTDYDEQTRFKPGIAGDNCLFVDRSPLKKSAPDQIAYERLLKHLSRRRKPCRSISD